MDIMTYPNIWWTCRYLCMFLQRHGYIYNCDILLSPNTFSNSIPHIDKSNQYISKVVKIDCFPEYNSLGANCTLRYG